MENLKRSPIDPSPVTGLKVALLTDCLRLFSERISCMGSMGFFAGMVVLVGETLIEVVIVAVANLPDYLNDRACGHIETRCR